MFQPILCREIKNWQLGYSKELLPSATDEEWYSPKRPYSTVVNLSFMTIFMTIFTTNCKLVVNES